MTDTNIYELHPFPIARPMLPFCLQSQFRLQPVHFRLHLDSFSRKLARFFPRHARLHLNLKNSIFASRPSNSQFFIGCECTAFVPFVQRFVLALLVSLKATAPHGVLVGCAPRRFVDSVAVGSALLINACCPSFRCCSFRARRTRKLFPFITHMHR